MSGSKASDWTWEASANADEVHALICASDAYTATSSAPAPVRNIQTTRRRVEAGSVHVLRFRGEAVATFTLTWEPPYDPRETAVFPPASKPIYISRLAVKPDWVENGSLVGVRCLRKAVELANGLGADAIRSEANPDLERVRALLAAFQFEQYGSAQAPDGRRRVYLQKDLRRAPAGGV